MPSISPPLPLPLRFALLTPLSPTKTLVPLLSSEANGLPIYLTLSPAHPPHVSLLTLLLALFPTSPLHIIKLFPPDQISLDLDGNAPFVDLWAPLHLTRELCRELGVLHLFRDERKQGTGLLGEEVEQMMSWEEDGCICHNWLPSSISITPSAYCLDTILSTSFLQINIIPDERYITTRLDRDRRARLVSSAEYDNLSRIRSGEWGEAWSEYLRWSMAAWKEFSLYPSRPPTYDTKDKMVQTIHCLLPRLASLSTTGHRLVYPLAQADIASLLDTPEIADAPILELIWQLLYRTLGYLTWSKRPKHMSSGELRHRERRARIQLGVVELMGVGLVSAFQRDRFGVTDDKDGVWFESLQSAELWVPEKKGKQSRTDTDIDVDNDIQRLEGEANTASSKTAISTESLRLASDPVARKEPSVSRRSEKRETTGHGMLLKSEDTEGWWLYLSIAGTIALAYLLSIMQ